MANLTGVLVVLAALAASAGCGSSRPISPFDVALECYVPSADSSKPTSITCGVLDAWVPLDPPNHPWVCRATFLPGRYCEAAAIVRPSAETGVAAPNPEGTNR